MKKQILFIHGGDMFDTHESYMSYLKNREITLERLRSHSTWKNSFQEKLGYDFDVLMPEMPNRNNAQYKEWKIWLERIVSILDDDVILIGHSLGGTFLAKYLSENTFSKKISQVHLVAPGFGSKDLVGEKIGTFVFEPKNLSNIQKQVKEIFIYHSTDDPVVPFSHSEKYKEYLPEAKLIKFEDRGHFLQEEFPEIVENIKNLN